MTCPARTILFELLCYAGDLARAERQLDVIGHQGGGAEAAIGVRFYQNLLAAEKARTRLFAEGVRPRFLLEPPPRSSQHLEALDRIREGRADEARALLDRAAESRPPIRGTAGGVAFDDFRDADDLLAPVLEVFTATGYFWVPWEQIQFLEVPAPRTLRDLLWTPAKLATFDGQLGEVFLAGPLPRLLVLRRRPDPARPQDRVDRAGRGIGPRGGPEALPRRRRGPHAARARRGPVHLRRRRHARRPGRRRATAGGPRLAMATPPVLDVEPLLVPIAGDNPSGRNLFYEPEYDELREARRVEDDTLQGDWKRKAKIGRLGPRRRARLEPPRAQDQGPPDRRLDDRGPGQEARVRRPPRRAPSSSGSSRSASGTPTTPRSRTATSSPAPGRSSSSTRSPPPGHPERPADRRPGGEAVLVPPLAGVARPPRTSACKTPEKMEELIAEGKITSAAVRRRGGPDAAAVLREPRSTTCGSARDAFTALDQANDERFGRDAPSLTGIRKALDDCRARHRADPPGQARAGTEPRRRTRARGRGRGRDRGRGRARRRGRIRRAGGAAQRPRASEAARSAGRPDPERRRCPGTDPRRGGLPPPERSEQPGPLPGRPGAPHGRGLRDCPGRSTRRCWQAPSSEARQALRRLAAEGEWAELLEQVGAGARPARGAGLARSPIATRSRRWPPRTPIAPRPPPRSAACCGPSSPTSPTCPTPS